MRSIYLCLMSVPLLIAQPPAEKDDLPNPVAGQPEAITAGRKLYLESCSGCHGPTAEGGRGPNLAQGDQIRGATNRHLTSVIYGGREGYRDAAFGACRTIRSGQLIAYLRNLTAVAFDSMAPGDVQAGSALFFGKAGCANCHTIRGRGGFPGSRSYNIGRVRSLRQLRESLLDPGCANRRRLWRCHSSD